MARGTNNSARHNGMSYTKFGYLFIAPFVVVYALFSLYPLLTTFWYSGANLSNANSAFWGFGNKEAYYDRYLDLTALFSDDELAAHGIDAHAYNDLRNYFACQTRADQFKPTDVDGLTAIANNPDISEATRAKINQVIETGDISYISTDAAAWEELTTWSANYYDLSVDIIGKLTSINSTGVTLTTVEASDDESSEDAITTADIIAGDSYAGFLDTLQTGEFTEGQQVLMSYLATYAGADSLYDYFANMQDTDVATDTFYYVCSNLDAPNAIYDGEKIDAIAVPFIGDLNAYMTANVWNTSIPPYLTFDGYIDGSRNLHDGEEQVYSNLEKLYSMGIINSQVQLVEENGTLVPSSDGKVNVLANMRQFIDSQYQSDAVKAASKMQIAAMNNYLNDSANSARKSLISAGYTDIDSYISFNGEMDFDKYASFKSRIGLAGVLTMDKYNELDAAKKAKNAEKAQAKLDEKVSKYNDYLEQYNNEIARINGMTDDDIAVRYSGKFTRADLIRMAEESFSYNTVTAVDNLRNQVNHPSGIFGSVDASSKYILVGFTNFSSIFTDNHRFAVVAGAFVTTFVMWIIGFAPQIGLALLLSAWFTDTKLKLKGLSAMKALMYLPNVITAATIAIFFRRLFQYSTGSAASAAQLFLDAIGAPRYNFFDSAWATRLIVCFINFWMWYGNTMIVLIAGITSISESLYESAQLDGANSFQTYTKITMPLLRPILLYSFVTSMIGGLQMYDIPYNLNMNPALIKFNGQRIRSIQTVLMYINELAFGRAVVKQIGTASAVSVVLFIVTTALSIIIFYLMRDKDAAAAAKAKKLARKAGV
ncbi:MAG: ABC transporter permease subunit [Saccharofermentans sp.]|nr:ABC transporter permease subunit [Saccharofermentans sp.]